MRKLSVLISLLFLISVNANCHHCPPFDDEAALHNYYKKGWEKFMEAEYPEARSYAKCLQNKHNPAISRLRGFYIEAASYVYSQTPRQAIKSIQEGFNVINDSDQITDNRITMELLEDFHSLNGELFFEIAKYHSSDKESIKANLESALSEYKIAKQCTLHKTIPSQHLKDSVQYDISLIFRDFNTIGIRVALAEYYHELGVFETARIQLDSAYHEIQNTALLFDRIKNVSELNTIDSSSQLIKNHLGARWIRCQIFFMHEAIKTHAFHYYFSSEKDNNDIHKIKYFRKQLLQLENDENLIPLTRPRQKLVETLTIFPENIKAEKINLYLDRHRILQEAKKNVILNKLNKEKIQEKKVIDLEVRITKIICLGIATALVLSVLFSIQLFYNRNHLFRLKKISSELTEIKNKKQMELKVIENELKNSITKFEEYEHALQQIDCTTIIISSDGKIEFANKYAKKIYADAIENKSIFELSSRDRETFTSKINECIEKGHSKFTSESVIGNHKKFYTTHFYLISPSNKTHQAKIFIFDNEAERIVQLAGKLLTHDFKNKVESNTRLIDQWITDYNRNDGKKKNLKETMFLIQDQISNLNISISSLTKWSNFFLSNDLKSNMEAINISRIIQRIYRKSEPIYSYFKINLSISDQIKYDDNIILGDKKLMNSLFLNIIDNAKNSISKKREQEKFSYMPGKIKIKLFADPMKKYYYIYIIDNGMGMEKSEQLSLFQYSIEDITEDTGSWGVKMCKTIIKLHKGKISVLYSSIEKGSIIKIKLKNYNYA